MVHIGITPNDELLFPAMAVVGWLVVVHLSHMAGRQKQQ
jgi:ABC-type uncharacterized transport system YnjBCD ATPase subunit